MNVLSLFLLGAVPAEVPVEPTMPATPPRSASVFSYGGSLAPSLLSRMGSDIVLRQERAVARYDTSTGTQATVKRDRIVKAVIEQSAASKDGAVSSELVVTIAAAGLDEEPFVGAPTLSDTLIIGYRNFGTRKRPRIKGGQEYHLVAEPEVVFDRNVITLYVLKAAR